MVQTQAARTANDVANKIASDVRNTYPELQKIKEDLNALKTHATNLADHLAADGSGRVEQLVNTARQNAANAYSIGERRLKRFEAQVEEQAKEKPGQTVGIAFIAGLAASFLLSNLGSRRY